MTLFKNNKMASNMTTVVKIPLKNVTIEYSLKNSKNYFKISATAVVTYTLRVNGELNKNIL